MTRPPRTRRFCINCNKTTSFQYNRVIGHSECVDCGFRFAITPNKKCTCNYGKRDMNLMKGKKCGSCGEEL